MLMSVCLPCQSLLAKHLFHPLLSLSRQPKLQINQITENENWSREVRKLWYNNTSQTGWCKMCHIMRYETLETKRFCLQIEVREQHNQEIQLKTRSNSHYRKVRYSHSVFNYFTQIIIETYFRKKRKKTRNTHTRTSVSIRMISVVEKKGRVNERESVRRKKFISVFERAIQWKR